jgi:hypothetical protein
MQIHSGKSQSSYVTSSAENALLLCAIFNGILLSLSLLPHTILLKIYY